MTSEYLSNFYSVLNLDSTFLEKVAKIITQKDQENPEYIESKILFDADELVNFGYLSVWRQFSSQTYQKHTMLEALNNWTNADQPKQLKAMSELKFEFSKKLAQQRIQRCDEFFSMLNNEVENLD